MSINLLILQTIRRAQAIREGGHVQRFHTTPVLGDASNARHQWNMAALYFQLHPMPQLKTLHHILHHDVAERWAGDTPAPAKYGMNPQLAKELAKVETQVEIALRLDLLVGPEEMQWIKGLDLLECFLFAHDQLNLGNQNLRHTLDNLTSMLRNEWVPLIIQEFARCYSWERTRDIIQGETLDKLASGQR